jgi:hypothetical protein
MQFTDRPLQHVGQFFDTLLFPGHLSSCRQASGVQGGNHHRGHEHSPTTPSRYRARPRRLTSAVSGAMDRRTGAVDRMTLAVLPGDGRGRL